jgi:glycosyltransferase involved in cell wall biosynthesis
MVKPSVSVILPAWNSQETVAACLESLRAQTLHDFEVILVDSSPNTETEELVRKRFPEVRFHRSKNRLWPHAARNLGVTLARGNILAFSDPDCVMSPDWLEYLMNAMDAGHPLVGGSVQSLHSGWFPSGTHLCKYAWWLPGGRAGTRPELPSANVSYTSELLGRIGPFPEQWCGDTLLSQRAVAIGVAPWFEPKAQVLHDQLMTWPQFLHERSLRGYDYGMVRPRLECWSRPRLLIYVLAAPLIVAVMLLRGVSYALASGHLTRLARCLPVVALGHGARAWGEAKAHWAAFRGA